MRCDWTHGLAELPIGLASELEDGRPIRQFLPAMDANPNGVPERAARCDNRVPDNAGSPAPSTQEPGVNLAVSGCPLELDTPRRARWRCQARALMNAMVKTDG